MGKILQDLEQIIDCEFNHVQFHSQDVQPGDLFFALKGKKTDGHQFLQEVANKGAKLAVIDKNYQGKEPLATVRVDDVLESLQTLAQKHLQKVNPFVIAITGDMGKTSTKEFLSTFLNDHNVAKNQGSFNTQITLPFTILNALKNQKMILLEMGMTQINDIASLVKIAPPDLAAITSLPKEKGDYIHAGFVDSYQDIIAGKMEIFQCQKTKGWIPHNFRQMTDRRDLQTFSLEDEAANCFGKKLENGMDVFMDGKKVATLTLSIPKHHYTNALVAALIANQVGLSWKKIEQKVKELTTSAKRFEVVKKKGVTLINDCYNASPIAYEHAIKEVSNIPGRKIGVLGHMGDLGKEGPYGHEKVLKLAEQTFDICLLFGQNWKQLQTKSQYFLKKQDLQDTLQALIRQGDVVFFKGSRVLTLETVFEEILAQL